MAKVPTILRGEDTAARGRSLAINLPEGDYSGLTIRLQICGLERSWVSPASGASLTFGLTAAETAGLPLGTHMGRLSVILADGTGYIISESIRLRVTDDVAEATGADNAIQITAREAAATLDIDLDGIEDEPANPNALRAAWKEFLRRLRAALAIGGMILGLALTARAEGRVVVHTAPSGTVDWPNPVVTNVTVEGELGLDAIAVTNAVTNIVSRGYVEGLGLKEGLTTNDVRAIVGEETGDVIREKSSEGDIEVRGDINGLSSAAISGNVGVGGNLDVYGNISVNGHGVVRDDEFTAATNSLLRTESDPVFSDWRQNSTLEADVVAARTEASLVYQLMMGSNVVAEVTNYNSSVRSPQLRLLQLEEGEYKTVWAETNGLARTLAAAGEYTDAVASTKADRAWSKHTSGLGADAPAGTTWISTPETVVAGGYEYERHVTTHGEVWILTSNGMGFGGDTNSYFRVSTPDGETLFSIEKTDEQIVGVLTDGITISGGVVTLAVGVTTYNGQAPICMAAQSVSGPWSDLSEGRPAWISSVATNGVNGAWSFELESEASTAFFYFLVRQPGATVIKNSAQTDLSGGILVEGTRFYPHKNGSTLTWTTTP